MSFPRSPKYKDSGVEWLGQVPAHWEVKPLKQIVRTIESGTSVNASDEPATDGKAGVLETSCVYSGKFDPAENKTIADKEVDRASCPLKIGTLIVSRRNTPDLIGAAGLVTAASANLFLPDRLWQVSLDPRATQGELVAALAPVESRLMQRYRAAQATQTAATHAGDARAEAAARDEISALLLFKSDMGAFVRLYTFLSQVFDYGNTAVEKRAIFFKRLLPLLEFGRERQGIDVSKLVLTHHNLKDQGRYAMPLGSGETPKLEPITDSGAGAVHEPQMAWMAELIQKVNDLFAGELTEKDKLVYVNHVIKGKLLESQTLQQQAASNTKEQFGSSPDLNSELLNAIMGALDAHTAMSTQALNSDEVRRGLKDILLNHSDLYEALRAQAAR